MNVETLEGEVWNPVSNYESLYEVSNLGRVKALKKSNRKFDIILSQFYNIDKYLCVNLYKKGKLKQVKVHRIVAFEFILNPENKKTINHIDGNKENNNINNLEWSTVPENNKHAWKIGLKKPSEYQKQRVKECIGGKNHWAARLVLDYYTGIYYDTITEAANVINMKKATLGSMLRGVNKNKTTFIYV